MVDGSRQEKRPLRIRELPLTVNCEPLTIFGLP